MKKSLFVILSALVILSSLPVAEAARADRRQVYQRKRIKDGVKDGEISKDEQKNLNQDQKAIQAEKKDIRSDGVVTKDEHKELKTMQNNASKDIYKAKHNDVRRDAAPAAPVTAPAAQ